MKGKKKIDDAGQREEIFFLEYGRQHASMDRLK